MGRRWSRRPATIDGRSRPPLACTARSYSSTMPSAVSSHEYRSTLRWPSRTSSRRRSSSVSTVRHGRGQRLDVADRHDLGRVAHHLGHRAGGGRHHGDAGGHGLERREPEPLVDRRVGQQLGPVQQGHAIGVGHPAEAHDAVGVAGRRERGLEGLDPPAVAAGHDQAQVGLLVGDQVERPHQAGVVLAGLDGADGEDVGVAAGQGPADGGIGVGHRHDAVRHGDDALGRDGEVLAHLVGDVVRDGVDPRRPAPRPARCSAGRAGPRRCTSRGSAAA